MNTISPQLSIFNGQSLKERGMAKAIANADRVETGWSERAYQLLLQFLSNLPEDRRWMTEQFRMFAFERGLPAPPSLRAFGYITRRAAVEGKIISAGFAKVTNPKAHQANANLWRKV